MTRNRNHDTRVDAAVVARNEAERARRDGDLMASLAARMGDRTDPSPSPKYSNDARPRKPSASPKGARSDRDAAASTGFMPRADECSGPAAKGAGAVDFAAGNGAGVLTAPAHRGPGCPRLDGCTRRIARQDGRIAALLLDLIEAFGGIDTVREIARTGAER